jgi:uncharacterized protein (DUF305 family)
MPQPWCASPSIGFFRLRSLKHTPRGYPSIGFRRTAAALGALTVGLALTLSACGDDDNRDTSAQVSTTEHNDADVTFATDMLQHHAQALSMVDLTLNRTLDPEVQGLADDIREAQGPEIETMADWLTDWDEEIPETMRDHANAGHDPGDSREGMEDDMDMPGMMTVERQPPATGPRSPVPSAPAPRFR